MARPVHTSQLGLGSYVGSALRYVSHLIWGTRQLIDVITVPVMGAHNAHKRRILSADAHLSVPGAWRPEFDDYSNNTFSRDRPSLTRQNVVLAPHKPAATLPFPEAPPTVLQVPPPPISTDPHKQTPKRDVWLDTAKSPTFLSQLGSRPSAPERTSSRDPAVKPLFRRKSFLPPKRDDLIEHEPLLKGTESKLLSTSQPRTRRVSICRKQLLKRTQNEHAGADQTVSEPTKISQSQVPSIQVTEPQTPAAKNAARPYHEPSPVDISMLDASTAAPIITSPQDVEMADAPPLKHARFVADSVITGEPFGQPPKFFFRDTSINELPQDRSPYRQPDPVYDMDDSALYDTPPDRFAASRDQSPTTSSSNEDWEDDLLGIVRQWHAELSNSPEAEKPSSDYYDWIDRRVQQKKQKEAAYAAYQRKIREAAEEKARQETEARKAQEALAALKLKKEAEKKAKEEEEARQRAAEAEAARKKAELEKKKAEREKARLAKLVEQQKEQEALKAAAGALRIIKPISEEWKAKIINALNVGPMQAVVISPLGNLSRHDFATLLPQPGDQVYPSGWLNDEIVNRYLKHITERAQQKEGWKRESGTAAPYHAMLSQWMTTMTTKGPAGISRWGRLAKLQGPTLLGAKQILIPICEGAHWTLLAVSPVRRTIEYLDSMGGPGDRYVDRAKAWLRHELKDRFVDAEWRVVAGRSALQDNGRDCGVFVSMNAYALVRDRDPALAVTHCDMPDARMQIAATLMNLGCTEDFDWE